MLLYSPPPFNFTLHSSDASQRIILYNPKVCIMKKSIAYFCLIIAGLVFLAACSSSKNSQQSDIVQSIQWQKDSLVIDGNDGDWDKFLPFTDEKLGLSYNVLNDRDNLYILARSNNSATTQRILRAGLTVFINTHGVKEEADAAGISFPTGNRVQKGDHMLNERPELQQNNRVALSAVGDYSIFGFHQVKTQENYDYGKNNPEGIQLGIGLNASNELVYEAMVPLSSFLTRFELNSVNRKSIAIGWVLENIPGQTGSRGGGGGVSIGGGLGFGSFGSGGGLGLSIGTGSLGRIGGGRNSAGKPTKIWRELLLARATK